MFTDGEPGKKKKKIKKKKTKIKTQKKNESFLGIYDRFKRLRAAPLPAGQVAATGSGAENIWPSRLLRLV